MNQYKTRGIVLHRVKYSETSVIAKIYTEMFGLESFILKGIRSSRSKIKSGLLQHLSLVDMVVYHNKNGGLQSLREIKSNYNFQSIPFDIRKSSIALFINEILYKSIKEETRNTELFEFIYRNIIMFDEIKERFSDFHFHFMFQLTKYLGFYPNDNYSESNCFFNLKEGLFQSLFTDDGYCIDKASSEQFYMLMSKGLNEYYVPAKYRKPMLNMMTDYYRIHVPGLNEIRSKQVLETVFQ
jgi:DNA repair protein RecO (recombination protein O)